MVFVLDFFRLLEGGVGRFYEGFSLLPQESHFREELNVSFVALILKKSDASDV